MPDAPESFAAIRLGKETVYGRVGMQNALTLEPAVRWVSDGMWGFHGEQISWVGLQRQ